MRLFPSSFASLAVVAVGLVVLVAATPLRSEVLTTALEVRSLTRAQADQGLEAHLRGTVVFVEPSAIFVRDDTSTIFFRPPEPPPGSPNGRRVDETFSVGDEIEVEGKTRMGLYLPGLGVSKTRVLHHGDRPTGIPADYDDLVSARFHYQRVSVEGVVRSVTPSDEGRSLLRLAMGSRLIDVRIDVPPETDRSLVDSRVRIEGLAAGYHNARRQLVQAHLRVIDWLDVTVLDPALPLARVPLVSAVELLAFQVAGRGDHRVRTSGTVTAVFPGERIFVRQDETAFSVRLVTPTALNVGDKIEVAGFSEMDGFSASVVDAEMIKRTPGASPAPIEVGSIENLVGLHDGQLVHVVATITDTFKTEGGAVVVLQSAKRTVQLRFASFITAPAAGSRVSVTAICTVDTAQPGTGFASKAGVVSLRARSATDLVVLESPPWWTVRRLGLILAVLGAVTLVAGLWIVVLRIQVRRQTTALRRRIESEAALEERQRIAREFHDSLEQELAGVSLRLDALATRELDEKGRALTVTTRHLVSRIQSETRNLISDLRDPCESAGDLAAALIGVAARHQTDNGIPVHAEITGAVPHLPAGTVHDLRMVARESVTNALKHANATWIKIQLGVEGDALVMRVVDDGRGFDPTARVAGKRGHFGCAGVRERCRKLGASADWRSSPGAGTTVEVTLPLSAAERPTPSMEVNPEKTPAVI